jgi:hypothetical protein
MNLAPAAQMLDNAPLSVVPGPSLGHVWADRFQRGVRDAQLNEALEAYAAAPSWEDRWFCIEHASLTELDPVLLDSWCEGWPEHVLPFLTRGAVRARQGHPEAESDLARASQLDESSPIPWGLRVVAGRAAGTNGARLDHLLTEMIPRATLYEPHVEFLRSLGVRNGGTVDGPVEFARTVCDLVPAGSTLRALLPLAAIDAIMTEVPDDHLAYLRDTGLFDDVLMAAGQSVFHPDFDAQSFVPSLKAMNAFAIMLSLMAQDDLALLLVNRIGGAFTLWPLSLLGSADIATWNELRDRLIDKAPLVAAANGRA